MGRVELAKSYFPGYLSGRLEHISIPGTSTSACASPRFPPSRPLCPPPVPPHPPTPLPEPRSLPSRTAILGRSPCPRRAPSHGTAASSLSLPLRVKEEGGECGKGEGCKSRDLRELGQRSRGGEGRRGEWRRAEGLKERRGKGEGVDARRNKGERSAGMEEWTAEIGGREGVKG